MISSRSCSSCSALVLVLASLAAVADAAFSKHACDFSNQLCQWPATYKFGATVMGDKAFYHGGIYSSDANTPVNGSAFQVLDLRTMSPSVMQVEHSSALNTSRYGHPVVAWRDKILLVGGEEDNANGATTKVLSIIALDLNTRTWSVLKEFDQRMAGDLEFLAATVAGNQLALVFQLLDGQGDNTGRTLFQMDLRAPNDKSTTFNTPLFSDIMMLDYPVVALTPLDDVGKRVLVMQAKRELDLKDEDAMLLDLIDSKGPVPLAHTASTSLKRLPGGTGGKVLAMSIIKLNGEPALVAWSRTSAVFGQRPHTVNAVSVYSVITEPGSPDEASGPSVTLKLSSVMMTLPLGVELGGVRSIDLPLLGSVQVSPSDVTVIPYIGDVDVIGTQDYKNAVDIQQTGNGFVMRGSGRPSPACQPVAQWQPFVVSIDMTAAQQPMVRAVSNNTWCSTRAAQNAAAGIVGDSVSLESSMGLHRVGDAARPLLMVLSPGTYEQGGGRFKFPDTQGPLRGAYIDVQQSAVQEFNITPPEGYGFPSWVSSCTTALQGRPVYVQAGGKFFSEDGELMLADGIMTMTAQPGEAEHSLVAAGGDQLPARALASMACSPSGSAFHFGGAVPVAGTPSSWRATGELFALQLQGKASAPSVRLTQLAKPGAATPSPRSGHALAYLAPGLAGLPKGGLLLYGGSNVTTLPLSDAANDEVEAAKVLAASRWDTTTWLFDLNTNRWTRLATTGAAPPGLMMHSMTVHGQQVMLFGGLRYEPSNNTARRSTDMFILDFTEGSPRWRQAAVGNINIQGAAQLEYPNTGIAALPESGVVAMMHRAGVSLAPIPQTIQPATLQHWGLDTLNLTAGDMVLLRPTSSGPLVVQQPLLFGSDVVVTGAPVKPAQGRHLLGQQGAAGSFQLQCGRNTSSAITIMSSGAILEGLHISGCNGSAISIKVDATGAYTKPAVLRNITLSGNNGTQGAAVHMAKATSAVMEGCMLDGNTATDSIVFADKGASLSIVNSTITRNNGTAVAFAGTQLLVQDASFAHNAAPHGRGSNGGALRLTYDEAGPQGGNSQSRIVNTTFTNNTAALLGGAMFMGPRTAAELVHCSFTANSANEGGAVLADRDACVASMSHVVFRGNAAERRGGAVLMRNPSCATISWQNATFANNTAGGDGGAMYLTEMSKRNIRGRQSTFDGNQAAGSVAGGGDGGALYLGLWASDVAISNTSFTRNTAAGRGGAINALAVESNVTLANVSASANSVLQGMDAAGMQRSAISEGGALAVTGSDANVSISACTMQHNKAGRGGAISVDSERGHVVIADNSSFSDNQALTAGGAVTVTERKSLVVADSLFKGNQLLWPKLAAGGGLHCYLCESVLIRGSHFNGNRAAYGGGAAVLKPARGSAIVDTLFERNVAVFNPADDRSTMRRLLVAGVLDSPELDVQLLVQHGPALLGPSASNTTADTGHYTGGGGLYLSLASGVNITNTAFVDNDAVNGGGLLARTDACSNAQSAQCRLLLSEVAVRANQATAGGGLLITNISSSLVVLEGCSAGRELNSSTTACLEADNSLLRTSARGRALLQAAGNSAGNSAEYGAMLVTSAAKIECGKQLSSGGQVPDACDTPIAAAPGLPFNPVVKLVDGLGGAVRNGIYDASMPMEAVLLNTDGSRAKYVLLGNTTQALNGSAVFAGLTVKGKPGNTFKLRFTTQNGLSVERNLVLRQCQAGEHTATETVGGEQAQMCEACSSPSYSFYPKNESCSQCAKLTRNAAAVCNLAAVVPASGFYQSHPRNPLLHKCIAASACVRSNATVQMMTNWAELHAGRSITQLNAVAGNQNDPLFKEYMELMCAPGYEGPLCGSCQDGHGHRAHACVKCLPKQVNSLLYFVMCCIMFLIPAIQMLMHSKNVEKRTVQLREAAAAMDGGTAVLGQPAAVLGEHVPCGAAAPGAVKPGHMPNTKPCMPSVMDGMDLKAGADQGKPLPTTTHLVTINVADSTTVAAQPAASPMVSPFAAASQAKEHNMGIFERMFGIETLEEDDLKQRWAVSTISSSAPSGVTQRLSCRPGTIAQLSMTPSMAPVQANMPLNRRAFKFWHADVLTMMVGYMQLLGLLRLIRLRWPQYLEPLLVYLDWTSGATTWVSLECSLSDAGLPRSIKRSITLLLWPVIALLALLLYWACFTAVLRYKRNRRAVNHYLVPHAIMSAVIMLYYLYTPTAREIISLFSCQPVDSVAQLREVAPESATDPQAVDALQALGGSRWPTSGYWTSDTSVQCGSAAHLGMVLGLGVPGLVVFVLGLPLALWLLLRRNSRPAADGRSKLDDPEVELKYGLMYDKYRKRAYYWEAVVLLENCALTLLLVLLQSQPATLQVLVAMAVIFIEAVLHITLQPYACRMLDTLRRISVFGLITTLFLIMLVSMNEFEGQQRLSIVAFSLIVIVNVGVLGVHVWACGMELKRWLLFVLDSEGRGYLTWADLRAFLLSNVFVCGARGQRRRAQAAAAAGASAPRRGPPQEAAVGAVHVANPGAPGYQRTGNVVVVHPSPAGQGMV